jgi:hypothetical protein
MSDKTKNGARPVTDVALPTVTGSRVGRRCRVPLSRLGKGETWLRRQILAFRARLEDAVVEARGEINEASAMVIAAASVALREAKRCERRRAKDGDKLGLDDELALSDRIVRNYGAAERAVAKLGLTIGAGVDEWAAIYSQAAPAIASPPPEAAPHVQVDGAGDEPAGDPGAGSQEGGGQ